MYLVVVVVLFYVVMYKISNFGEFCKLGMSKSVMNVFVVMFLRW